MRVLTPNILVAAITELSEGDRLVRSTDVISWCERNAVDYQGNGRNNQAFWDADLEEARGQHRLLKFKRGASQQARVAWALAVHASKVRESAEHQGWYELGWNGENWNWRENDKE